jgi:hypothetical protein
MSDLPVVQCPRVDLGAVTASAKERYWSAAQPLDLVDTVTGTSPKQGTIFRVGWNGDELRVLFEAVDLEPWATLTTRDAAIFTEEVVEVFLDPVGDARSYFEIEVNPLNTVLDLMLRRNRSGYLKDFRWQCEGLKTAVVVTEPGWRAELSIPLGSVSSEPVRAGTEWRANFFRIDRPRNSERELSAWSATRIGTFHVPGRFGRLQFVD